MKIIHILPGDSLVETFKNTNIEGEIVVCRECLIEGEIQSENLYEFWKIREKFINDNYGDANYQNKVAAELKKLQWLDEDTEVNLWFEYELFCQTNMWFCLYLLNQTKAKLYRVEPIVRNGKNVWAGFGKLEAEDLRQCFAKRIKISKVDLALGANLWKAYQSRNLVELASLSQIESDCFPRLKEVCKAEIEKSHRPQTALREIISSGETDFSRIFDQFNQKEGVYGFGDAQLKRIWQNLL